MGQFSKVNNTEISKKTETDNKKQKMAALSDKLADAYQNARPRYPIDWFTKLAARTGQHKLAWDVGTGNGQAAVGVSFLNFHLLPKSFLSSFHLNPEKTTSF